VPAKNIIMEFKESVQLLTTLELSACPPKQIHMIYHTPRQPTIYNRYNSIMGSISWGKKKVENFKEYGQQGSL
jgi:hypothetical protein